MHIVLDLHVAQAKATRKRMHSGVLSLVRAIAVNRGEHVVTVVVDGQFKVEADQVRKALSGHLPRSRIRVWHSLASPKGQRLTDDLPRIIREAFIAQLAPDLVLTLPAFKTSQDFRSQIAVLRDAFPDGTESLDDSAAARVPAEAAWDRVAVSIIRSLALENADRQTPKVFGKTQPELLRELATAVKGDRHKLLALSQHLALDFPGPDHRRSIFVDISELALNDSRTGCQRVTRSILLELIEHPPCGFQVEPVEAVRGHLGYRYARNFIRHIFGQQLDDEIEDRIDVAYGDIFFGLDFHTVELIEQQNYIRHLSEQGVKIVFFLHDLLSIERPDAFVPDNEKHFRRWLKLISEFDGVIANSRATRDSFARWLEKNPRAGNASLTLDWVHLGSDIERSLPSSGLPDDADDVLAKLASKRSFLTVGTIEPRKGYRQTLDAFEALWASGRDVNLVIVGHSGWQVEAIVARLRSHPEKGMRLFWLEGISDEYLTKVYAACDCLIAASEGEGFGLPIVEAARHGLPIIARDIPVFVELAGEHAVYFGGLKSETLVAAVEEWLSLYDANAQPLSNEISLLTWKETASRVAGILTRDA